MERRTKLILLIIGALILLAIGLYILLQPFLPAIIPAQPPSLPSGTTPTTTVPATPTVPTTPTAPAVPQDIKRLEDLASIFVTRMGSGSNVDGFTGYDDVMLDATPSYRETLMQLQADMRAAHPAAGHAYGLITRVVSVDSRGAVSGAQTVDIILQVQQAEDAGNPTAPTGISYYLVTVGFERQSDGSYLVDSAAWEDIHL